MAKGYPKPKQFIPVNPHKYIGDPTRIITRSSWEVKFLKWADTNPNIFAYSSEEVVIPYMNPVKGKMSRYFVDALIVTIDKTGKKVVSLIEIKPYSQTKLPKQTKGKRKKTIINETMTYAVNQAKWEAAEAYCKERGWNFLILTEKELYGK